ncbi:MAG: hypothetical protein OXF01_19385, partial [Gemmatimonadetes bacterium]|nr:hypothetical protein [Gemmatimonadota bacterium]
MMSSRRPDAPRFSRQIAPGSPSSRTRRQTGSQGRAQGRARNPGETVGFRVRRDDSREGPVARRRVDP